MSKIEKLLERFAYGVGACHSDIEREASEKIIQLFGELLEACQMADKFIRKLEEMDVVEPNSNSGLDWDTRFILSATIAKAEGSAQ